MAKRKELCFLGCIDVLMVHLMEGRLAQIENIPQC